MRRKMDWMFLIPCIIAFVVFIFSVWKLSGIYTEYKKGTETYEKLNDYIQVQEPEENMDVSNNLETGAEDSGNGYLQVDFDGLKKINPDVIAWIYIPALEISYPVVQGTDNFYYLHHLFDGQKNESGSIFVDFHNKPDFTDRNTIVYGHNMQNGSMFGTLEQYQDQNLYQQYPCFYIYVPGFILEYQIVSCYAGRNGSIGYTYSFPEIEDFQEFLNIIRSYAGYDTGTDVGDSNQIVTLSTCVNSDGNYRYLVHGKLVQKMRNKET